MNIVEMYKKSFSIAVSNPFVTMFLVLFMIASNILAMYMFSTNDFALVAILLFCILMLSQCFMGGWFYVIKNIIDNNENKNRNCIGVFFEGVGKNIIPVAIGTIIYLIIMIIFVAFASKIAQGLFGNLDFIPKDINFLLQDNKTLFQFFENLTLEQKSALAGWQLFILFSMMLVNFITLFYFPAIIYNEKSNMFLNAFSSLFKAISFIFKNFFQALLIYVSLYVLYLMICLLKALLGFNFVFSILLLFVYIYFISGAIMLIFMYYEQRNNCTDGCHCIRENEDIDRPSKEI